LRLTAPNLGEAFIAIRQAENGPWAGVLKRTTDGDDLAVTAPDYDNPGDAWQAAFELHREHFIV